MNRCQKVRYASFAIGLIFFTWILTGHVGLADDTPANATSTRFCFQGSTLFSFDDIAGWTFDSVRETETPLQCIHAERTIGSDKVATLSVRFDTVDAAWSSEKLTGLATEEIKFLQSRKGDPVLVGSTEFLVNKLFAAEEHEALGYFSFATAKLPEGSIVVTLSSATREGHDKNYQAFRSWVRTFQKPTESKTGVSH